jgi:uncharacterized RDD family membrane protein YckC
VEGALAPDPARSRVEPLREIPGFRKKERTWKDEVRDRVRDRRQQRAGGRELPLFREDPSEAVEAAPDPPPAHPAVVPSAPEPMRFVDLDPEPPPADDLPLRPAPRAVPERPPVEDREERLRPALHEIADAPAEEWLLGPAPAEDGRPVERPARWGERLQAGIVDLAVLGGLWATVVYFAGRAAHTSLAGLRPSWPYLAAYLAFLGLLYAAYFTGSTGQTLGKHLAGLQVVDAEGHPPGWRRALARAVVGSLGILLLGSVLFPILVDPARRGFHDRLLKTRVVKH